MEGKSGYHRFEHCLEQTSDHFAALKLDETASLDGIVKRH
jgi:hypothetical protein